MIKGAYISFILCIKSIILFRPEQKQNMYSIILMLVIFGNKVRLGFFFVLLLYVKIGDKSMENSKDMHFIGLNSKVKYTCMYV